MTLSIRTAQPNDRDALHEAHMPSIREVCVKDHGVDEVKGWGNRELGERWITGIDQKLVWVVADGSKIKGIAAITFPDDAHGHIQALYLTPEILKEGLGRQLMNVMLDEAKRRGIPVVTLDSTITAHEFYKLFGFQDVGPPTKDLIGGSPVTSYPMSLSFMS